MSGSAPPVSTLGLGITTVGRPALTRLLRSAADSTAPPELVAIANQSGGPLHLTTDGLPFEVRVIESHGGASTGRNAAVAALGGEVELLAFPNDDSTYPSCCLQAVRAAFAGPQRPAAVACSLVEDGKPRFAMPSAGPMDLRSVWRAIEPATFARRTDFEAVGGFRPDLGTGCSTPWQSGEGTDLLLRLMASGHVVLSCPDLQVCGAGERRELTPDALVAKHRGYARGTGRVYMLHPYSRLVRTRILFGPWLHPTQHDPSLRLSLRLATARSLGRLEGLLGRTVPSPESVTWQ